jgi:predicted acetyltransferase
MEIELRPLSLGDGADIYAMLCEIGPGENGLGNSAYGVAFADFPDYLKQQDDMSKGLIDLSIFVPQTVYWLIVDRKPVGMVKLRHYLNDKLRVSGGHIGYCIRPSERGKGYGAIMLAETLKQARKLGIDEVMLTCSPDNTASIRTIERSAGMLESSTADTCTFWIKVPATTS